MLAIRQVYEHAPPTISIPESIRDKRLEVIMLVQEETPSRISQGLKELLAAMPDVGDDADFESARDLGRTEEEWDS